MIQRLSARKAVLIAALSAVLLAGCGGLPTPTPFSLGNGLVRYFPQSDPSAVNQPTALILWTHCGLDQTLIDFAGVLWQPVALPRANGGVVAPPPLVNDPRDEGTITVLADGSAVYEAETGRSILLRAVRGHRDLMVCY